MIVEQCPISFYLFLTGLFYWKQYRKEERIFNKKEILRKPLKVKRVSDEDRARMTWKITKEKVGITLKRIRNNVAPGVGGFCVYFYKVFSKYLKTIVVGAINEVYINGELTISQRFRIFVLTPKGDKDRRLIGNWRPLTVLETLYKLTLAILANRMKPTLDIIIGSSQMAYLPGRFISECTRNAYDLLGIIRESFVTIRESFGTI